MTNGPWTTELRVALGPGRAECSTGVPGAGARASELLDWCGSAARHRGRVLNPVLRLTDSRKPAKLIYPHGLLGVLPSGDSQHVDQGSRVTRVLIKRTHETGIRVERSSGLLGSLHAVQVEQSQSIPRRL